MGTYSYTEAQENILKAKKMHMIKPLMIKYNTVLNCLPGGSDSKDFLVMRETWVRSLGHEDLEKGMAMHSSILAWKMPWTEEPGGLQSMGLQSVRHNGVNNTFTLNSTGMSPT